MTYDIKSITDEIFCYPSRVTNRIETNKKINMISQSSFIYQILEVMLFNIYIEIIDTTLTG